MRHLLSLALWLPLGLAATPGPHNGRELFNNSLTLPMLDSIIARQQGVTVNASVKTSVLEGGLLLLGIREVLQHVPLDPATADKYEKYSELVMTGLIPTLANVTADAINPLDLFSVGTQFIKQYVETGNTTLLATIQTLHEADLMRHRQKDGSYWYFVYRNVTTQDGLFSISAFKVLYASVFDAGSTAAEYASAASQFSNIVDRSLSHSTGLLYHGYDPTRDFPVWGNLTSRGHSSSIWARAMGWTVTGLLETLDVIPAAEPAAAELRAIFVQLMKAILHAQDQTSGAWFQVMNFPNRQGNYLESSATGLFAHAMLRGVRLGYLGMGKGSDDQTSAAEYVHSAERAYQWLATNAVLDLGDGTIGYNLTVDVCSINSTTTFDFYVSQQLKPNSLLGEVALILTGIELMLRGK